MLYGFLWHRGTLTAKQSKGCSRQESFLIMSSTQTQEMQLILQRWLKHHRRPSAPLRRGPPTTITCLFFLLKVILILGVHFSDVENTSGVRWAIIHIINWWVSTPRALYPGTKAFGKARWARRRFACHPNHMLASINSFTAFCLVVGGYRIPLIL